MAAVLSRVRLEQLECEQLARYAARSGESRGRRHPEAEHPYRSIYQRDRDRIIHCTAFRRLEYKTQVFVNHEGDYYRTRLTHTIEVAQIARSIARALNLNEDLTEAAALAHDLGHTPFGHAGEEALQELMKGHGGFNHNLQGLRVVDVLENRYADFPGLNLSYEVRESLAKHRTTHDVPESGPEELDLSRPSLLEAQVMEIADAIAYDSHDLDDSLKAGLITLADLEDVSLWQEAEAQVKEDHPDLDLEALRVHGVRRLIDTEVTDLLENTQEELEKLHPSDAGAVRELDHMVVRFSAAMQAKKKELEAFLMQRVYKHYRVVRMANKARRFVTELFNEYLKDPGQLPPEFQRRIETEGRYQSVCDYIAGMTDRYAQDEYLKLFSPYEKV